jgi:GTP cyclohydrolase IV
MTGHRARHVVHLGLGANLGDRQLNIARAIGQLRRVFDVEVASSAYDTAPVGKADQPRFVNLVVRARTDRSPREVLAEIKAIERDLGRRPETETRNGPRPIDIDLLLHDDIVCDDPPDATGYHLQVPHPRLHERAFVLVPLAEIDAALVHPVLGVSMATLRDRLGADDVRRIDGGLLAGFTRDVQAERPAHAVVLQRVGVTGLERVIRLTTGHPVEQFYACLDLFVDLRADQKGVHMSRFPDLVDQTLDDAVRRRAPDVESLAGRVAEDLVRRQDAARAEVRVRVKVPRTRYTPLSAQRTQDVFTLLAWAVSNGPRTVRLVGVEVEGMTACPCAQEMLRDHARGRLAAEGFSDADAERVLGLVPVATHTQRSRGTLVLSAAEGVSADDLVRIVEASMSSEIYELLKRPDEFFVVNRAHQNPKFVEDVVRDMLGLVLDAYPDLPGDAFLLARQVNDESIHRHDVLAERGGTASDIRRELAGGAAGGCLRLETWLDTALG